MQINPGDEGRYDMVEGIRLSLDREYPNWKNPKRTHMVPDSLPSHQTNKGSSAEEVIYDRLKECGTQREEPMFVVHSFRFSEHIPESGRKKSWVMGETDFVIVHKNYGPILIQVKATETGRTYKEAENQLLKDKLSLQKRFEKAVEGILPRRKVTELFGYLPAFVAMPNCPRPPEICAHDNALYQEDCSTLEGFDKWWDDKVVNATHPAVSQEMYEYLVIR